MEVNCLVSCNLRDGLGFQEPYQYDLPAERIAQRPVHPYHSARLLHVDSAAGVKGESTYWELPSVLRPSDVLVFNDTRVIPARLFAMLAGKEVEILLLRKVTAAAASQEWICTGKPLKRFRPGQALAFPGSNLSAQIVERISDREVLLRLEAPSVDQSLAQAGLMPIPPYIRGGHSDEQDKQDYQTFFSKFPGSVAAPTASLHFTPELFDRIRAYGCSTEYVTLHVGSASFLPVWVDGKISPPGTEYLRFDAALLSRLTSARAAGRRVVAVGTTVVRALESMMCAPDAKDGAMVPTNLFIQPTYEFRAIDALITNFHQPGTTHLFLVEAFMQNRAALHGAYEYALAHGFRFLSYGDGMIIGRL